MLLPYDEVMHGFSDFLKGFGFGLIHWAANRVVFTVVRIAGIIGFLNLIWCKPEVFAHPYAPFVGIGMVVLGGILWRLWAAFPPKATGEGSGWDALAADYGDDTKLHR